MLALCWGAWLGVGDYPALHGVNEMVQTTLTDDEVKIIRLLRNIRSEWRNKRDVIVVLVLSDNSAEIGAVAPKGKVTLSNFVAINT